MENTPLLLLEILKDWIERFNLEKDYIYHLILEFIPVYQGIPHGCLFDPYN